jgi:L-lactate utilization protein LutB
LGLQIETEVQGEVLLATFRGTVRLATQVCDIAAEKRVQKVLFNASETSGALSTIERYYLGAKMTAYLVQFGQVPRIAIVGTPSPRNLHRIVVSMSRCFRVLRKR